MPDRKLSGMSCTVPQLCRRDPFRGWVRVHLLERAGRISAAESARAKDRIYGVMDDHQLSPDDFVLPIYLTIEVGLGVEPVSENHHELLMRPQRRPDF